MRNKQAGFGHFGLLVAIVILAGVAFTGWRVWNNQEANQSNHQPKLLIEKVPKSPYHSPDGTWWGYNQAKIARYDKRVFMYVIDNQDDSNKTSSKMVIYQKNADGAWQAGASFTTSRPGNILIDSKGVLHAFVFQPLNVKSNDSIGKLIHYYFPKAGQGDIKRYKKEVVIDNDDGSETVNIRVGAAIAPNDTLSIGFGLTEFNPRYKGHSEHLYYKKPASRSWQHLIAGQNLGHDYYYPFVFASHENFYLMPVQDDYYPAEPARYNIYQKILLFKNEAGKWSRKMVVDLSDHPLAKARLRLLEQSDLWVDSSGHSHMVYKQFTHPEDSWRADRLVYVSDKAGRWTEKTIGQGDINWARLFDYKGRLFFLLAKNQQLIIKPVDGANELKIDLPSASQGYYPYVASSKTGQSVRDYLDVILHASDSNSYNKASSYYLRVPAFQLDKL